MSGIYLEVARSYLWRRLLWTPAVFIGIFVALIEVPGLLELVFPDGVPSTVALSRPALLLIALVFYLWMSGTVLGAHFREQLSNPRARLWPGFVRAQRVVAAGWLASIVALPAVVGWWIVTQWPGSVEMPSIAAGGTIVVSLCALGVGMGFFLPAGGLLVLLAPFVVSMPLSHDRIGPLLLPAFLAGAASMLAFIWTRGPEERTLAPVAGPARGIDANRIEMPLVSGPGRLAGLLFGFDERGLEHPAPLAGSSRWARIRHRQRSLPSIRLSLQIVLAGVVTWLMLAVSAHSGDPYPKVDLDAKLWPFDRGRAALEIGLIATLLVCTLNSWAVVSRPVRWLGYELLRVGSRSRYAWETLAMLALKPLVPWGVVVVAPAVGVGLWTGRPLMLLGWLGWLVGAYAAMTAMTLIDAFARWLPRPWWGRGLEVLNAVSFFAGFALPLSIEHPLLSFLPLLWLIFPALVLRDCHRRLCVSDLL